ncbi:hypothetical protein [Corynebacterium striatum]
MSPGMALFYGGMSGRRQVLNMMMPFGVMAVVPVIYVLWGWSMSYGSRSVAGLFGSPFQFFGRSGQNRRRRGQLRRGRLWLPERHRYCLPSHLRHHLHRSHFRHAGWPCEVLRVALVY